MLPSSSRVTERAGTGTQFASVQAMANAPLARRVDILEEKVEILSELPQRITAVEETLDAMRTEMRRGFARVDGEFSSLRKEMTEADEETRRLIREGDEETRRQMREGDEETRRHMRVLHEDVIARLALIQENRTGSKAARRKPGSRRTKR